MTETLASGWCFDGPTEPWKPDKILEKGYYLARFKDYPSEQTVILVEDPMNKYGCYCMGSDELFSVNEFEIITKIEVDING